MSFSISAWNLFSNSFGFLLLPKSSEYLSAIFCFSSSYHISRSSASISVLAFFGKPLYLGFNLLSGKDAFFLQKACHGRKLFFYHPYIAHVPEYLLICIHLNHLQKHVHSLHPISASSKSILL